MKNRSTLFQDFVLENGLSAQEEQAKLLLQSELNASPFELSEFFGHGPLEEFFAQEDICEVLVNGPDEIWVERAGILEKTTKQFSSEEALRRYVRRILSARGKKVDQSAPFADCTLEDGSRVHVAIPPVVGKGICLSVRRFRREGWKLEQLCQRGMFSPEILAFLRSKIRERKNIFVCGGTGSGKTSLLGALISEVGAEQRVISLEDIAEIKTMHPHFLAMEARPANLEGGGEIAVRRLLKESLRMRPDRIVVGECRGPEALDMILALNTGHRGSMATIHASSPREALQRLETLALLAAQNVSEHAIQNLIASSVEIIVHLEKSNGRKISSIAEMKGVDGKNYLLKETRF